VCVLYMLQVRVQLLPEEKRTDFSAMLGAASSPKCCQCICCESLAI
jgi:hypothetical protein